MVLTYEVENDVVTVTLDRPEQRNALTAGLVDELQNALEAAAVDGRIVILTGAGSAFCAGVDMKESPVTSDLSFDSIQNNLKQFQSVTRMIREIEVPVIAKVNGPAMGAGSDIALAADFRIAATDAIFCESFVNVGVVSGDGGAYLLPRLLGEARAKELLLLGREVTGEEAAELGLVTRVVPAAELDDAVEDMVDELRALPPSAVAQTKQLVNASLTQTQEEAYQMATYAFWICLQSDDFADAREAFREDRDSDFS